MSNRKIQVIHEKHSDQCHYALTIESYFSWKDTIYNLAREKKAEGKNEHQAFLEISNYLAEHDLNPFIIFEIKDIRNIWSESEMELDSLLHSKIDETDQLCWLRKHILAPENVLIYQTDTMKNYKEKAEIIMIDGTFRIAPRGFTQVLTFIGYSKGLNCLFPLIYAFLPSKSNVIYELLFDSMEDLLDTNDYDYIISDFEQALLSQLQKRIKGSDVNTRIHGCRFHFVQCLRRKYVELYKRPTPGQKVLFKIFKQFIFLTPEKRKQCIIKVKSATNEFIDYFISTFGKAI